ncbi:putative aldehyde dehydrogenase protein [Phaeoacremonium minimum UCRPA7]|uniref:aldehyde dehydrogenase (NAD(+)) n=1 Tax=Phaeoacremonium minimum (strain UCR-PA7) TaxID=1286976 RepID=R8BGN2_PHAM7|nr:putative aldehyde dehydrogenase protein [Phaeoacremonium minimum UCRPA7]EON98473.1 putative aldehyde dehydrogenase protein [Phaeoacremonium minimum UCRPA7]
MDPYLLWIGGSGRPGRAEHCHAASAEDVEDAVWLAHTTFKAGIWSKAPRHTRADVLDKAAALLTERLPTLIKLEVRQTGRAIREMNAQVPSLVKWFKYYAALLRTEERSVLPTVGKLHNWVDRVPLGVVVQITPFNHPLLIAVKKIAPALAAGNSVIVKPSELTPLTTLVLAQILKEAGVPDGAFNVLPGYGAITGKALVEHPLVRKVDVTGGTVAGRAIGAIAGKNLARFTAELGGKAPLVVFEQADIDVAVNGIVFGSFIATQLGNVETLVNDAVSSGKATAVIGGGRMIGQSQLDGVDFSKGYFFPPTILTSTSGSSVLETRIWREEAFGPVIVVVGFDTEEQAINLANDSEFGLGAAVWTKDLAQAFRVSEQIDAGIVWVNTHHRNDPSSPWGGGKSSSGVGSENGIDAYHEYTTMKSTIINYATSEEALATDDWFREGAGDVRYG